ncbi:MAG: hypothetical protein M3R55_10100 [Acidobacteriota bacterium]|nr:hypothetical protein [Acidobacteriota bacterium]
MEAAPGFDFTPWGLGETGGRLFTVSGFTQLARLEADGRAVPVARFTRAVANLFDLDAGMAVQFAVDDPGTPLAWQASADATLTPMPSLPRISHGLSRPEDGLLNLLSCSAPPRAVCWLPSAPALLAARDGGLTALISIGSASSSARQVLDTPGERAIEDAVMHGQTVAVLHRAADGGKRLDLFDARGALLRTLPVPGPLRLLVYTDGTSVVAIDATGRLVRIPW